MKLEVKEVLTCQVIFALVKIYFDLNQVPVLKNNSVQSDNGLQRSDEWEYLGMKTGVMGF